MRTLRFLIPNLVMLAVFACRAQITDPGWFCSQNQSFAPASASFTAEGGGGDGGGGSGGGQTNVPGSPIAEAITPQIQALADGLGDNPTNIFNYVHDHIKFVLYFGSKKGANLTLLEKSGNDFDQCALLTALLSAAGYTGNRIGYHFGWEEIPYDDPNTFRDLHHWWQLTLDNTNWTNTVTYIFNLATFSRNYPIIYDVNDGQNNNFLIQRVWVRLVVGSTPYLLDPAFKISEPITPDFSFTNAIGTSTTVSNALLAAAGGTNTTNYCSGLSEASVRSTLTKYTTNLLNYIQSAAPNASVQQVLGGWQIVPANDSIDFSNNTWFPTEIVSGMSTVGWIYEPTNLMSTLQINFAGTSYQWFMPQLQGDRVSLTYSNNGVAQLWQDDTLLAQGQADAAAGTDAVTIAVTHPVGTWDTNNNIFIYNPTNSENATVTNTYQSTNADYAIMYAFEPDWGWLQQRENRLDTYLQEGLTNGTRQVTSETLNIMGLTWMLQTEQAEQMLAAQLGILPMSYHRIGRMAQETGHGYYVDAYMQVTGEYPSGGDDAAHLRLYNIQFDLWPYFFSAMEHGLIEQLQNSNLVAASTVKMLEIASTNGQPVYLASSGNWSTGYNVQSHLTAGTYDVEALTAISNYVSQGYYVLLPQSGSNHVSTVANGWAGYAYEALQTSTGFSGACQMKIGGSYNGGYVDDPDAIVDPFYTDETSDSQPTYYDSTPFSTPAPISADPVDTADGTYQVENTDLSIGQAEPRGITLSRYYNGTRRFSNAGGMTGGWVNNYCVTANNVPAPQAVLGGTTPEQAASMFTATAAAIAMYNGGYPDPKNWLTTALIAKWGIDQLTKSGVSVNLGKDTLQFVQQPNGVFVPPANCTATLTQINSAYQLQNRHGNTFKFNASGYLTNIVDQYGNGLKIAYTNNLVQTITDWANRNLTFYYTGSQLTSVSDGTRTVGYGYSTAYNSQGDLTSFTDAQGNITTYQYDTNHDIIATLDAQNRMVVSNVYNTQGELKSQYVQGNTNKMWLINWSGYTTTEFDPAGDQQSYLYDDLGRLIATEDALGNVKQIFYDGQNHVVETVSPLGETNQSFYDGNNNLTNVVDPLGYTNRYFYDSNNNLVKAIDPRGNTNSFGYNSEFSPTGQTNGAGDWENYVYNPNGTLASSANSGGTTTYGYDSFGQLNSIAYPNGLGTSTFANRYTGDVTNFTDGRGFATACQYNALRQLTNSIAPTNLVTRIAYDPEGNQASSTDARGNIASQSWSATGKLLSTTLPTMSAGTPIATNLYDNRDWLTGAFDPLQNETTCGNDPDGRLILQTDPVLRAAKFTYDNDGRKLAIVNAASETNSQTWNAKSQLIALIDGAGHFSTRAYDSAGNQTVLTNRNSNPWHFYFDGANRPTNTVSPLGRSTTVVFNHQGLPIRVTDPMLQITTNGFDAKGRLTNCADKVASTFYRYDANDNLTNLSENGSSNTWTYDAYDRVSSYQDVYGNLIQYRYDANGNLTNLVYPGGRNVYYAYDSNNHMTSVTDWSGRITAMAYDLDGRLVSVTRPNGTYRTISYDSAGEVTNILEQMANGLPIALMRYNWDLAARMSLEFIAPLPPTNSLPTRTMQYDSDNELTNVDGNNVTLDKDGNLTAGPLTNDTFVAYQYDARNRLTNAAGVFNVYDAANNRIGQIYGTNSITYIIDPNRSLPQVLERVKNGVTTYYVYGPGLLYQVTETSTATNTLTYHYDYRGSTIALTGDNGLVTDRMEYSLYATMTYRAGASDTPFLFNGQFGVQSDPNGLLYMRARYYNPFLCRFLNPDPSGFAAGLNFYAYANGNPASMTDPLGLDALSDNMPSPSWDQIPMAQQRQIEDFLGGVANLATFGLANVASSYLNHTDVFGNNNLNLNDAVDQSFQTAALAASVITALPTDGASLEADAVLEGSAVAGRATQLEFDFASGDLSGSLTSFGNAGAAEGTAADSQMITVLGSGRDVAPYVGQPGFNTFTGAGIPAAELDTQNALWLNNAIQRGDQIWLVTDPAAHQALMNQLNLQSAYLNLELPMMGEYSGVNAIPKFVPPAAGVH